jgi:hypothetical protein
MEESGGHGLQIRKAPEPKVLRGVYVTCLGPPLLTFERTTMGQHRVPTRTRYAIMEVFDWWCTSLYLAFAVLPSSLPLRGLYFSYF